MTFWEFVSNNPGWTLLYLIVIGLSLDAVATAIGNGLRRR